MNAGCHIWMRVCADDDYDCADEFSEHVRERFSECAYMWPDVEVELFKRGGIVLFDCPFRSEKLQVAALHTV